MSDERATFRFADIAGFTALTEAHGDEQAAGLVADFCEAVKDLHDRLRRRVRPRPSASSPARPTRTTTDRKAGLVA
jgi:class 3 adenylate cyclase